MSICSSFSVSAPIAKRNSTPNFAFDPDSTFVAYGNPLYLLHPLHVKMPDSAYRLYLLLLAPVLMVGMSNGLFAPPVAHAQSVTPGVKGGITFMEFGGSGSGEGEGLSTRTGITLGLFADVPMSTSLWLRPELIYIQKGEVAEFDNNVRTRRRDYIEMPLLAHWVLDANEEVIPRLFAGPTLGINIQAAEDQEIRSNGEIIESITVEEREFTNRFELGIAGGVGLDIPLEEVGTLVVDVRYQLGLTDIRDSAPNALLRNQGFSITAGISL